VLRPRVRSAARAVEILQAVAGHRGNGISAKELAETLQLPRQVVYHLAHTLVSTRMLRKAGGSRYMLGLGVAALVHGFRQQLGDFGWLVGLAEDAARVIGETAYVVGWMDGEIVVMASAPGRLPIPITPVATGTAGDAHARAAGKLLLALAPDSEIDRYLQQHPLLPRTPYTLTDRAQLSREIEIIRRDAVAYEREEYAEGLSCIAVPLGEPPLQLVLGISAPTARLQFSADTYLAQLREMAGRRGWSRNLTARRRATDTCAELSSGG
jgi:DNA-binding IclR family transcriptional regulator